MVTKSPASSSTSSKPASTNTYESGKRSAKQALAAPSKLQLGPSKQAAPSDQQGRRRSSDAFHIQTKLLEEDPNQPREIIDEKKQLEITSSMAIRGVDVPLMVQWDEKRKKYRIVDGAHRYRAAIELELKEVPCIIREGSEKDVLLAQFITNHHRSSLKTFETIGALVRLRDDHGMSPEEIMQQTGITASDVTKYLKMNDRLVPEILDMAKSGAKKIKLSRRHLYSLSQLPKDQQPNIATRGIKEHIMAEKTEELVNKLKRQHTARANSGRRPMTLYKNTLPKGTAELRINRRSVTKQSLLEFVDELRSRIEALPDEWST